MSADALPQLPLFQNLPDGAIQAILEHSQLCVYPDQAILCTEGQPVDCIHILTKGTVQILKAINQRDEQILTTLQVGETIGEMNLFSDRQVRTASVRAAGEVHTINISLEDMEALVREYPQIAFRLMYEISERFRNTENQLITHLRQRNRDLEKALEDLKAAQAQLVVQERIKHELAVARNIQQSLLPKQIPTFYGWEIHAVWEPARAVSGDFYDFIPFPDGKLGLIIGDVTGKGVPAALVMAISRSVLHAVANNIVATDFDSPGDILGKVNTILCQDMPPMMFVTCLLLIQDLHEGSFSFANAGHVLPIRISSAGLTQMRATGMPLGMIPDQTYECKSGKLAPGESLFFISDGLVEAHNPHGEMFGIERLNKQLVRHAKNPESNGQILIHTLIQELHTFTGDSWEQEDDLTFMTLSRGKTQPSG